MRTDLINLFQKQHWLIGKSSCTTNEKHAKDMNDDWLLLWYGAGDFEETNKLEDKAHDEIPRVACQVWASYQQSP